MSVSLTTTELVGVILLAVGLAATDAAALSRIFLAWLAKKLGVKPAEIRATDQATDGDGGGDAA